MGGIAYELKARDGLYVGMGAKEIRLQSKDPANPAKFYIKTCPAHQTYSMVKVAIEKASKRPMGTVENDNKRTIY